MRPLPQARSFAGMEESPQGPKGYNPRLFGYSLADILQMTLGSKNQGSQFSSCRQFAARRGQCAGTDDR